MMAEFIERLEVGSLIFRGDSASDTVTLTGLASLESIVGDAETPDAVTVQAAVVAAPSAITAAAPAALTSEAITGGESPTEAEHNAVQADLAATRAEVVKLVTDITALRTTVANTLAALKGSGKPMAAS